MGFLFLFCFVFVSVFFNIYFYTEFDHGITPSQPGLKGHMRAKENVSPPQVML